MTDAEIAKVIAEVTKVAANNRNSRELRQLLTRAMWPLITKAKAK